MKIIMKNKNKFKKVKKKNIKDKTNLRWTSIPSWGREWAAFLVADCGSCLGPVKLKMLPYPV